MIKEPLLFHSLVIRKVNGVDYSNLCVVIEDDYSTEVCAKCDYGICEYNFESAFGGEWDSIITSVEEASPFITFLFSQVFEFLALEHRILSRILESKPSKIRKSISVNLSKHKRFHLFIEAMMK